MFLMFATLLGAFVALQLGRAGGPTTTVASVLFGLSCGLIASVCIPLAIAGVVLLVQASRPPTAAAPASPRRPSRGVSWVITGLGGAALGGLGVVATAVPIWALLITGLIVALIAAAIGLWELRAETRPALRR